MLRVALGGSFQQALGAMIGLNTIIMSVESYKMSSAQSWVSAILSALWRLCPSYVARTTSAPCAPGRRPGVRRVCGAHDTRGGWARAGVRGGCRWGIGGPGGWGAPANWAVSAH